MTRQEQYEADNAQIKGYRNKLKREYEKLVKEKEEIRQFPERYSAQVEEWRSLVKNAFELARKLKVRKGDQGGYAESNRELASEVKRICYSIQTIISRYYHPYELETRAQIRLTDSRSNLRETLGPSAKDDLDFLFDTLDTFSVLNDKYAELSSRAKKNENSDWMMDVQQFRGELAFIIKRCKVIYKKYHDNEEVSNMIHRKIVYNCRYLDIRLAKYIDPITDLS